MKVIVISENQDTLLEIRALLVGSGIEVEAMESVKKFLQHINANESPDFSLKAVIGDLVMSSDGGGALLNEVRGGSYASVPVILMASVVDQSMVKQLLKQGLDGLLCKPFSREVLLRQIEQATSRRESIEMAKLMSG